MNKFRVENAAELGHLGLPADTVLRLQSFARRPHRLSERQCNGHQTWDGKWDEAAAQRDERLESRLESEAKKLALTHGFRCYFQGDPRGWPLYLIDAKRWPSATDDDSRATEHGRGTGVCPH